MSSPPNMSEPYRTPAQIAADIPPPPKGYKKPWPRWYWKVAFLLGSVVVDGALVDLYGRFPSLHGIIGGAGLAVGLFGLGAFLSFAEEIS